MPEQYNPFGGGGVFQVQPSDMMSMLQANFPTAPMPNRMAIPDMTPQQTQMIDLGAGAQPGPRKNGFMDMLGSLVSMGGQLAGSALSARSTPTTKGAGAWGNSALGNTPNITAPQLSPLSPGQTSIVAPKINTSLTPQLTTPVFKFEG